MTNLEEYQNRTDPHNPDTDGDGYNDGLEVLAGTDPLDPSSHPNAVDIDDDSDYGSNDGSGGCLQVSGGGAYPGLLSLFPALTILLLRLARNLYRFR